MTFKHKLSQRLALLRDVMLLGLVLAVACERLGPTTTGGSVSWVDVVPATVTATVGQTVQLTAIPRDANGNPLSGLVITWSATNAAVATVSTSGLVTSMAVGVTAITATSGGHTGTAAFTVSANNPPPPPAPGEPTFDPATDSSLWSDSFESYATTPSLSNGSGLHTWFVRGLVSLMTDVTAFQGTKYVRFDYTSPGAYNNEIDDLGAITQVAGNQSGQPGPSVLVVTYQKRDNGRIYKGKEFIISTDYGNPPGTNNGRFVLITWGGGATPPALASCYGNMGPTLNWNRDFTSEYPSSSPAYPGNAGYPAWYQFNAQDAAAYGMPAPPNPNGGGTVAGPSNDGRWHRFTWQFTKELPSVPGTGRVEGWIDGIKVQDWIGDDPARCEYRMVYTVRGPYRLITELGFPTTTSGGAPYLGGAPLDFDALQIWTPTKQF